MIRVRLLASVMAVLLAAPLFADDARLVTRLYDPDEVVRIEGRTGVQASIAFADNEQIENVAVGDSASWQITPNKRANLLFVKPMAAAARTNMTVVTDKRTYFFDLVASAKSDPLYVLRFTYPDEPKPAPTTAALNQAEQQALEGARPVDPAALNFAWRTRGSSKLLPARIYDDGEATYAIWPPGQPVPAMLVRNDKGEEGPVNFAVRGQAIVIEGVPALIVLRVGKNSATLEKIASAKSADPPPAPAAVQPEPPAAETPPAS